ncbi:unnamed protein product [Colias eurytheme]|nr:unnamed protein product [Colias eurytheme]
MKLGKNTGELNKCILTWYDDAGWEVVLTVLWCDVPWKRSRRLLYRWADWAGGPPSASLMQQAASRLLYYQLSFHL